MGDHHHSVGYLKFQIAVDGRPVSAQPDTFRYRANKFVGRNTAAVVVASILLLVMTGATIVSLTLYNRAEIARREAVQERGIASRERNAAVSTSEFLQDLLASVSPVTIGGRLDITVREILDEASVRLENDMADEPEVAAALHYVIGRSYVNLGDNEAAERHLWLSVDLRQSLSPPDEQGILRSQLAIGQIKEQQGSYAEAESLLVAVLPADPSTADPAVLSELEASLARVYAYLSRLDDAETFARRAVASAERTPDPNHVMHAQARSELGNSLYRLGRFKEAEIEYREAIDTAHRTIGEKHIVTGQCYNNHALGLGALGRNEEAITQLLKALTVYEVAYPADHPEFATVHMNLADQYYLSKQYAKAEKVYVVARDELTAAHGADHVMVSLAVNGLGNCYWKSGKLEEASDAFKEAIRMMDAALGSTHPWVATPRNNLGLIHRELGESDEAERLGLEALEIMRANLPEDHIHLTRPLTLLAKLDMDAGDYDAAVVYAREVVEICSAALDEDHTDRIAAEERLAECLLLSAQQ